jgi:tetratricopeptide (TPR) repeat protein
MKGTLTQGTLPRVMRDLYVGRRSGMLHLSRGDERRSVRFQRGNIINADTNVPEDHMGEILLRKNWITRAELERAAAVMTLEQRRMGQVFLDLGILDKNRLEDAVALHVHEILYKVFVWNEGTYDFREEPDGPLEDEEELTLKLSTGELILEAVRQIHDPDVIRYNLGDMDRVLALPADPLLRFQRLTLTPTDGFVLSRVDGTLSGREIVQMIPLAPEETQKSLFSLVCVGAVEYALGPPKTPARAPKPVPAAAPAPPPPAPPPAETARAPAADAGEAPAPPPTPPAAPAAPEMGAAPPPETPLPAVETPTPVAQAPPPPVEISAESAARRQEILDAFERLKSSNHFEILGIPRASNDAQVKEAYFRLAKRFHPDAHHDRALADLREKLEAVFIRLGEAYEVLRHARTRASYEETLAAKVPRPAPPPGGGPVVGSSTPADPAALARAAEQAIARAAKFLEKEQYWDAIQVLDAALPMVEGKLLQKGRLLWARAKMKNPNWVKEAEEKLRNEVLADDPRNVEALYLLGVIYRDQGLASRAQTMFKKVLELKPDHEGALAEVPKQEPEPEAAPEKVGLLKKLFKKS